VPTLEDTALCRAAPEEVWKLLYDPARFPEWWASVDRVEGEGAEITRYMREWPDFAYPTALRHEDGRVIISCLLSDIVHEWVLEPSPEGCVVRTRLEVPEAEAGRVEALWQDARESLVRLVRLAEAG
jgi:uncharacterized protein YndB with AHSA1/START domain